LIAEKVVNSAPGHCANDNLFQQAVTAGFTTLRASIQFRRCESATGTVQQCVAIASA